jgi:PleD family two-component response regulator
MILAALDDLMFTSRIRAAAAGVGAEVRFARTAADASALAREFRPGLILLDLNARGFDPLATLGALKGDAGLAGLRIVGFVSHVQSDVIAAARSAGIDEVLARSAFVARLPELLRASA